MPQTSFSADRWIAAALRGERPDAAVLSASELDSVEQAAIHHGVEPLVYELLCPQQETSSRRQRVQDLPDALRARLAQITREQIAWDLLRQRDLRHILDQLAEAGIAYLLIKGAGLAYTHYRHSYLRYRCDTDILFPDRATFDKAWGLLEAGGFRRQNTLSGKFVGYQHCCYRPLGPGNEQVLDCHIKINDYLFFAQAFDFDELFEESVPVPQLAQSARTLGPMHALLMACIHRVASLPLGNADRMIWLYDMYLLARSFSADQWDKYLCLAREKKLCGSCIHSLRAAQNFFPLDIPGRIMAELEQAAEVEPFKPGAELKRWQYYYHVFRSSK